MLTRDYRVAAYANHIGEYIKKMRKYEVIYQDKRSTETTSLKSNGSNMHLTLRGIDFEGLDFEMLTGEIDETKFDYEKFEDGSGALTNFKITIKMPLSLFDISEKKTFTETLTIHIVVGETITIKGLDSAINSLTLSTSFGDFTFTKELEWMEDVLIGIQKQLPDNIYLKTCLSCKYSNYSPYGNGMFGSIYCFKHLKDDLKELNGKHDLLDLWTAERVAEGKIFSVQETFDCSEHQIPSKADWYYKSWSKIV
ncbi:MAG: hypothetical protein GQ574_24725 [Crocinitomix sp.]|nr:hypothetical protein [Crocinitomix sp.]